MESAQSSSLAIDWQMIWREHSGWIRTVLRARLGCERLADEVLQDVNVTAWQRREQLCDSTKVAPWLYRIALRQVLMHWRGVARANRLIERVTAEARRTTSADTDGDPLAWLTQVEAHAAVRESLAGLSPQEREILLLKHAENWTYEEVASRLGVSRDKVIYRLARAQQRMRVRLQAWNWD